MEKMVLQEDLMSMLKKAAIILYLSKIDTNKLLIY